MNEFIGYIIAALIGASGWIPLLWRRRMDMATVKKDEADAAESVSEAWRVLLEPLQARVAELERLADEQRAQIVKLERLSKEQAEEIRCLREKLQVTEKKLEVAERLIDGLVRQITDAGLTPRFDAKNRSAKGGEDDGFAVE